MVIYSEKTKKKYDTVEECAAAEAEFDREQEEIAKKKEMVKQEKATREKELSDAYQAVIDAEKNYRTLLKAFLHDYGEATVKANAPFDPFEKMFLNFFGLPFDNKSAD